MTVSDSGRALGHPIRTAVNRHNGACLEASPHVRVWTCGATLRRLSPALAWRGYQLTGVDWLVKSLNHPRSGTGRHVTTESTTKVETLGDRGTRAPVLH